mmetsp:Transcript_16212/g.31650  ORF Transcript_16212/g.31650 Transcript_16212/m.31650 type:complete len:233 (-) Transcript_16212:18-716(-)
MRARAFVRARARLQLLVLVGQRRRLRHLELLLQLLHRSRVERNLGRAQRGRVDKGQVRVADNLAREPQKRLLKVVVGLGGDVVILQVLLPVEGDLFRLHLALLHIDLVADQHDRDGLAHANQIAVPVGHILVGDTRCDVEHDDGALALDVVAIAQAAELLLAGGVPDVEDERAVSRAKLERVHLHAERRDILLLEFAGQVALHEGGLADAAVAHEHQLERRLLLLHHGASTD